MSPFDYLASRLKAEMYEGNMHGCLRDVGRLAGGYLAAGSMTRTDVDALASIAESLSLNRAEANTKWTEAVEFGRLEPVKWDNQHAKPDRAFDWNDTIGDDYQVVDPRWVESIETVEPETWNPVAQVSEYLSTLFSSEEFVGYVTESWEKDGKRLPSRGNYDRTAGQLLEELARYGNMQSVFGDIDPNVGAWIRFNPLDGEGIRDSNVADFRFALVESDDMPVDQQRGVYEQLELPIAALVHSGNKSLHAIVRIDADDLHEYRRRVDLLYEVCGKNGLSIDRQNRNPSRLSRMPGVERNGNRQFLVGTNLGKPSWSAWEDWIEAANDNLPDPESLAAEWPRIPPMSPPLIDGVLRQGHKMLVSGPSKAGKSFLLIQLCAAIAEGREWLGWRCTQGRVLYVNLELDRASCLHRFRDVYEALDWHPSSLANIDIWNLRGQAVPMDRLAPKLIRRSLRKQYTAVVIDPIYKVITGDENSADKMAHFCNQFDRVCHELKASVIYCHHHSKGSQGAKRSMDRASGSGVFARDPDALLDLIELVVSDHLRKQQENAAVCALVARTLDRDHPGWRAKASDDDLQSESQMRSMATRIMGHRYEMALLPLIPSERKRVNSMSAWRVEGTFREYPRTSPTNCWFDYPRHRLDADGVLHDADTHDAEPPWKRGARSNKGNTVRREQDRETKLIDAFKIIAEDGKAKLSEVAEYLGKSPRTIRGWTEEFDGWTVEDGIISQESDSEKDW
jgi:RecA-family ATPase